MATNIATAKDVSRLLGDIDPIVLDRILAIGASPDEIDEAVRALEQERGFGEESYEPSSPKVTEVRALMEEAAVLDDEDEQEDRPLW